MEERLNTKKIEEADLTLELEERELLKDLIPNIAKLIDIYSRTDFADGRDISVLTTTKQLMEKTKGQVGKEILKSVGYLLDALGTGRDVIGKAEDLSRKI